MTQGNDAVAAFIKRWEKSEGGEHRTYVMFLSELCDLLGVERPSPDDPAYGFERRVDLTQWGVVRRGRMDLYKAGCFVLEAKQGSFKPESNLSAMEGLTERKPKKAKGHGLRDGKSWDDSMLRARAQALRYAENLPSEDGIPPFLIVVDIGYSFELYANFSRTRHNYTQFPDGRRFRFKIGELTDPDIRDRLRKVWTDPWSLDPARESAKATRMIADKLARLAQSLEKAKHAPKAVADFLMRCLFTMFAEDMGLLKARAFTDLLIEHRPDPAMLRNMLGALWRDMNTGSSFCAAIRDAVPHFNGALFADASVPPLSIEQIDLLIEAAKADWKEVEPAIFGALLERALDPEERHKLGAHYTPRAYVERLVLPTVIEPLREQWHDVKIAAMAAAQAGDLAQAVKAVKDFHHELCSVTVLDPACGSGNFLYVTLAQMKQLESEVIDLLTTELGERQDALDLSSHTVDPHQFLGLEKNERAVPIAEMVLWIGHLQWYARSRPNFTAWPKPVLRRYGNIEGRDAVLNWRSVQLARDDQGRPLSRWDGVSTKIDPVTGAPVPDESKRVEIERYVGAKPAEWPPADFIVGNPPFIGAKLLRQDLGDGYAEALWSVYGKRVPNAADFVMYWWHKAADKVRTGKARRFGFITTNSLPQTFNRRVVEHHMAGRHPIGLLFAIPDHPWVKALNENEEEAVRDAAQVRIAMTVGMRGATEGKLLRVTAERKGKDDAAEVEFDHTFGMINSDLTTGADVTGAQALRANERLSSPGVKLHGSGFIVTPEQAAALGRGRVVGLENHILAYRNGKDLADRPRGVMVIDLFGLSEEEVRRRFPEVYQWLRERVLPHRKAQEGNTADATQYAAEWWLFGKTRPEMRKSLSGLPRYIATGVTSKHRIFQFLDASIRPDDMLIAIAFDDAYHLGVLSSRFHVAWALAAGSLLGPTPRYIKTRCFDTFPFPEADEGQKQRIRALAEELDALRKRQQAAHAGLTLTGIYNVLAKLRSGAALDEDERAINAKGLVGTLRTLHDDLDRAVAAAYGWPADLPEAEILSRLAALNKARRAEEVAGKVRWLRPDFQTAGAAQPAAKRELDMELEEGEAAPSLLPWPKSLPEQVQAVRAVLPGLGGAPSVEEVARRFRGAKRDRVAEILQIMAEMG